MLRRLSLYLILSVTFPKVFSLVHPISVKGNYFLDSVTNEPVSTTTMFFFVYQITNNATLVLY